jgi:hypothetical protein
VIWNNFVIPDGATFDLIGRTRLVFRTAVVDGKLAADNEGSLLGAGEEKPKITGGGKIGEQDAAQAAEGINNSGDHKEPPALSDSPSLVPVSGMYVSKTSGGKTEFDESDSSWSETGAVWTWPLKLNEEELTAYFVVNKSAGQTVTVGEDYTDKVTVITDEEADGTTPGDTAVVVAVDMEDVVFDGTDEDGKGTMEFPLVVSEEGKSPVTVNVNVEVNLPEDATIYEKTDGKWKKVDDPQIPSSYLTNTYKDKGSAALTEGKVRDLQNAIAWVDTNAKSGTGADLEEWTTKGYQEYRIFIKKNELIGRIILKFNAASHVALELYGAGKPGMERHVSLNHEFNTTAHTLNHKNNTYSNMGFITVYRDDNTNPKTLVLEKNITIDGRKWNGSNFEEFELTGDNGTIDKVLSFRSQICVKNNPNTLIMRPHSKITGHYTKANNEAHPVVDMSLSAANSNLARFYMDGGEISGNNLAKAPIIRTKADSGEFFYKNGAVIKNNLVGNKVQKGTTVILDFDKL